MKILKITKNILASLLATILFFSVLEIAARLMFPEFRGQIHSAEKTLGMNYFLSKYVPGRVPYPEYLNNLNKPLVLILGDSISHGYGQAYEDIYWVRLQRLMQLQLGEQAPEFISLSYYGNNLNDSTNELKAFFHKHQGVKVSEIIYQFNFNDIVSEAYSRTGLHQESGAAVSSSAKVAEPIKDLDTAALSTHSTVNESKGTEKKELNLSRDDWFKKISLWRSEYLNYSVFLRAAQHYAGSIVRKKSGTCEDRGLDGLGPYTWTFGSRKYAKESEILWQNFEEALSQLVSMAEQRHIKLSIVISPLLFDIDTVGIHPYYNYLNYDFSCATISPTERLRSIAKKLGVNLYDPTQFIKHSFDVRLKEKNFTPFFFTADENHITPVVSSLMADYLYISRNGPVH
jgi:hypothetical protein